MTPDRKKFHVRSMSAKGTEFDDTYDLDIVFFINFVNGQLTDLTTALDQLFYVVVLPVDCRV